MSTLACGCRSFATSPPPAESEKVLRRPDGVALDLPAALPETAERGEAHGGVLSLREAMGDDLAADSVRSFLTTFLREDLEGLDRLLAPEASSLDGRGSRHALLDGWRTRFRNLDYTKLTLGQVVDLGSIERYRVEDLENGTLDVAKPPAMTAGDALLRVPMLAARMTGEHYFGEYLALLVRQHDGHVVIVAVGEDDAP